MILIRIGGRTAEHVTVADYRVAAHRTCGGPSGVPVIISGATCAGSAGPCPQCELQDVPLREADNRPTIDLFPSFLISPAQSYYEPVTSPITADVHDYSGYLRLDSPATIDQYIAADGDLLLVDPSDLHLLSLPLLPVPVADVSDPMSLGTPSVCPFEVDRTPSGSGDTPQVLENLPGCQYWMTSYDAADRSDLDPAYGLHLHDPRFLEYVGAPESARLLSRTPDYWIHHMD